MTAPVDLYAFTPSPERAWALAKEGGIRLNEHTKVHALIHAASETDANLQFIGNRDNWLVIRRLMRSVIPGDEFGSLISAIAGGQTEAEIRKVAEYLVGAM